jgi:hypothetical protein
MERTEKNLFIWDQVKTTDPKYTKKAKVDGQDITAISGTYQVMRATETFGPVGEGWGWDVLWERFDEGAPLLDKDGKLFTHEKTHTLYLRLWYRVNGATHHVRQYGHTRYLYKTEWGYKTDHEYAKKSLTDAIKTCLSCLGFSADIHLGLFDDQTYVEGLLLKQRLDDAGDPESAMDEARNEFKAWLRAQLDALSAAPNGNALNLMRKQICEKARAKAQVVKFNPADIEQRVNEAAEVRLEQLDRAAATTEE